VCNLAIARYSTVLVRAAPETTVPLVATERPQDRALVEAASRRAGVRNIEVALYNDFPVGAGLGGSSAAGVALASAMSMWRGDRHTPAEAAEASRATEVEELGVAGGRQDHYAAAYGGALGLRFHDRGTDVERIALSPETQEALEQRCLIVYTGESRISGETITAVLDAYQARDRKVLFALQRMKALAEDMARALSAGDVDALGALVGEHWAHQRSLHTAIPTPTIDAIVERARRAGALGAKALGASGGGCVLVIAAPDNRIQVQSAIATTGSILPFGIDVAGVTTARWESPADST
jgi:D-glycero-alpha-D-manno-heptose-7-phosphate kinase